MAPNSLIINELCWPEDLTGTVKAFKMRQLAKAALFGARYGKGYLRADKAEYTPTEQRLRELGHMRLQRTGRLWALPPDFKDQVQDTRLSTGPQRLGSWLEQAQSIGRLLRTEKEPVIHNDLHDLLEQSIDASHAQNEVRNIIERYPIGDNPEQYPGNA